MTNRTALPARLRQEVALEPETRTLLWEAAKEIERLHKVIDDYVRVCKSSAKEIKHLRER